MKTYNGLLTKLEPHQIFVFGSNTQGFHGGGAALAAKNNFGAIWGQAKGLQGQSWAIVTKNLTKDKHPSISMLEIVNQLADLYAYASNHPKNEFFIAYSGTGYNLNYYTNQEMAYMFFVTSILMNKDIPSNIVFSEGMYKLICKEVEKHG